MDDIKYKLQKIKIHRLLGKLREDLTNYMYDNTLGMTIEEFVSQKYPEIGVDVERKYDETDKIWRVNIMIRKPVVVRRIVTVFTLTPQGIKYIN